MKKIVFLLSVLLVLNGCFAKKEEEKITLLPSEHEESFAELSSIDRYVLLSTIQANGFLSEEVFWNDPISRLQILFPNIDLTDFSFVTKEDFSRQYATLNTDIPKNLNWIQLYKYIEIFTSLTERFSVDTHQIDFTPNSTIGNIQTATPYTQLSSQAQIQIATFTQQLIRYERQKQERILQSLQTLKKLPQEPDLLPNDERKFYLKIHSSDEVLVRTLTAVEQKFPHVDFWEWKDIPLRELEDILDEVLMVE